MNTVARGHKSAAAEGSLRCCPSHFPPPRFLKWSRSLSRGNLSFSAGLLFPHPLVFFFCFFFQPKHSPSSTQSQQLFCPFFFLSFSPPPPPFFKALYCLLFTRLNRSSLGDLLEKLAIKIVCSEHQRNHWGPRVCQLIVRRP